MDPKKIAESLMANTDMKTLSQILGNGKDIAKKAKSMSAQERNALLASLSNHSSMQNNQNNQNQNELSTKNMSDMTEEEKKTHREELKRRLRGKQNMLKHARTPRAILEQSLKSTVEKATEKLSEINNLPVDQANQVDQATSSSDNKDVINKEIDDNLDDFVN
jgi:hypothetical protein